MKESEFLENFAKILGADNKFKELEEKRLKEKRMLESLGAQLGVPVEQEEDRDVPVTFIQQPAPVVMVEVVVEPEPVEEPQEVVEEIVENVVPVMPDIPVDTIVTKSVEKIAKVAPKEIQKAVDEIPGSVRREIDAVKKSITDLHRFAQRHSQMGGGGEVKLLRLDDVDATTVADGLYLRYDEITRKLVFDTPAGSAGTKTEDVFAYVTSNDSQTIHKGDPVYLYRATGNRPSVILARNTGDAYSAKTLGLAWQDISPGSPGWIQTQGVLTGIDTSAYAEGDTLYLGNTAGTLTNVKPYAPNHLVYIGVVVRANKGQGQIYIRPQNGYELDEIHDVNINHNVVLANGHTLVWNANNSLWENQSLSGLVATFTSNNSLYLGGIAANQYAYSNQISSYTLPAANTTTLGGVKVDGTTIVITSNTISANLTGYQTTSGLSANVATLASNNSLYLGGVAANQYAYANQITTYTLPAANATTLGGVKVDGSTITIASNTISANLTGYQTTSGLSANVATLTSNNSLYLDGVAANQYAYANSLTSYQTTSGLSANVATLTSNNSTYLSGVAANQYAYANSLTSYQTTSGLSANVAKLSANSASYLGTVAANQYAYANGSNLGTLPSLAVSGVTNLGNNYFAKAGSASGDVLLDNGSTDTPGVLFYYANNNNWGLDSYNGSFSVLSGQMFRVVNNLNESGGAMKAAFDTSGNFATTGFVYAGAFRAGQVIKDVMLSNTEFSVLATTVATSTSDTDFISYSYTPTSSSSYIIIHVHVAAYDALTGSGGGSDSYFSRIKIDGNEIVYSKQATVASNSFRTGTLFPLIGRYTNSNTAAKAITVGVRRDSADDSITIVNSATALWMRITEIAR